MIEAWAYALSQSEFSRIEEIRASGNPDTPALYRRIAGAPYSQRSPDGSGLADGLEEVHGDLGIDRDLLWACALCHDVGKPFEFSPRNQQRWKNDVGAAGYPAIRHSVYGVHVR
ncbi:MAG: HD domain-containing protein [Thermomicrobiales bacterium]